MLADPRADERHDLIDGGPILGAIRCHPRDESDKPIRGVRGRQAGQHSTQRIDFFCQGQGGPDCPFWRHEVRGTVNPALSQRTLSKGQTCNVQQFDATVPTNKNIRGRDISVKPWREGIAQVQPPQGRSTIEKDSESQRPVGNIRPCRPLGQRLPLQVFEYVHERAVGLRKGPEESHYVSMIQSSKDDRVGRLRPWSGYPNCGVTLGDHTPLTQAGFPHLREWAES